MLEALATQCGSNVRARQKTRDLHGIWVELGWRLLRIDCNTHYISDYGSIEQLCDLFTSRLQPCSFELAEIERRLQLAIFYKYLSDDEKGILRKNFFAEIERDMLNDLIAVDVAFERCLVRSYCQKPSSETLLQLSEKALQQATLSQQEIRLFQLTVNRFLFIAVQFSKEYVRTRYDVGGASREPIYQTMRAHFYEQDAKQCILLDMLAANQQQVYLGAKDTILRSSQAYEEIKGPSYRQFASTIEQLQEEHPEVTDQVLVRGMRAILKGAPVDSDGLKWLPNLVAAWFIAEPRRCSSVLYHSLMLLDLIEQGIILQVGEHNLYRVRNTLIHYDKDSAIASNAQEAVLIRDLYGDDVERELFDGTHPMANGDSKNQMNKQLSSKEKLTPSQQKEASLIMDWLRHTLVSHRRWNPDLIHTTRADQEPMQCDQSKAGDFIKQLWRKDKPNTSDEMLKLKWDILHQYIMPTFQERFASMDNLLAPTVDLAASWRRAGMFGDAPMPEDDLEFAEIRNARIQPGLE